MYEGTTLISYNSRTFLDFVKKWYDQLLPIVAENQITNGGCIILVQLCNEIGMVHWLNKAADYSPSGERLYREFLKKKYVSLKELNKVYGQKHKSFSIINMDTFPSRCFNIG